MCGFLSVERLINATIKQVDQQPKQPTVNKLTTKLLREHGPINWPKTKQANDACLDALGHFSSRSPNLNL